MEINHFAIEKTNNTKITVLDKKKEYFITKCLTPQVPSPFQKSQFFVYVNSNFVIRFLTIGLT